MSNTIDMKELVESVNGLISFPLAGLKINELIRQDQADAQALADIIRTDPALSAAVLRVANSAALGSASSIDDVGRAVTRLGRAQIQSLTLGLSLAQAFKDVPVELVSMEDFWRHSLYCAAATQIVADKAGLADKSSAFTAGLLHDIGHLILFTYRPEQAIEALEQSRADYEGLVNFETEKRLLGFDHAELGAAFAKAWSLPDIIVQCIGGHHHPMQTEDESTLVTAVHLGNSLAVLAENDGDDLAEAPPIDDRVWDKLGLEWYHLLELTKDTVDDTQALLQLLVADRKAA